jgi:pilus assembly protein FimV
MVAKRQSRALALLLMLPSAAFALGLGDIRLLSPLNAPLDAEIEVLDATPEDFQTLQAQVASRDKFAQHGLEWPVFLSSVQVKTSRTSDGHALIKLKSTDAITDPFITLLIEVNWARGHMMREYTMLLDPPVYTPGQTPASNAPVAAPVAGASAREGSIARAADVAAPAAPAPSQTQGGDVAAPASETATSDTTSRPKRGAKGAKTVAPPPPSEEGAAAGNSHVVQRGETLSSIAASAAGAKENSPETHSWMLAIYQANPRAFEQNMNLLRTGAVLRMPDNAAVSAVSPSAAATEIRRQYAAWRGTAGAEGTASAKQGGQLHLVTPSDDSAGAAATSASSGQVKALQGRVQDLENQLNESKRLVELKNAQLADLQAKLAAAQGAARAPAEAAPPAAAQPPAAAAPPPPPPAEAPPVAKADQQANTAPPPAEEPPAQQAQPAAPPAAAAPPSAPAKRPPPKPVAAQQQGGGLIDSLMDYWWALALLVVAVAGYLGFKTWRARRQSEFDDSLSRLAVAGASSAERGFASGDTTPMRPVTSENPEGAFLVEESGTHQRPRFGGAAPAPASARHVATADETISTEAAINLDQGDPLAEADFHMAYGLYDQAADLIRIAINREPDRRDLKLKLLEVFFVWGNKEQFLTAARELAATRADAAPGEWEKIVIMGKQLAPDDPLFAGGGTTGATAGGVDLDLEGGQSRVDFDLLGEPVPGTSAAGDVDLDIGSALGESEPAREAQTDRNTALEPDFGSSNSTGTTRQMTARIPNDDDMLSGFGAETEGPTVEQPALSSPDNPTIRQKVAMALKQSPATDHTEELAIDDLGLDLAGLDTVDQPGLGTSSDAPTLVAGMDDRSRKIIEEAQRRAASEDTSLSTGAWQMDENELDAALAADQQEHGEHDGSVTSRLSQLTGSDVDYDLGEAPAEHATNGSGLDLDLGTATVPDAAFTATQKLSSDDLALPDLEPVTMSEVGTKLDLARAYMDMGDPDGAKNILEEVLHEGSMTQKQEAQRLMESLPG